ncbi:MAG: hypothetical protein LBM61_01965, partial [Prevotellaceae bacterium]|nr:hypothetical protein [Prevotellaceae bacterium]
MTYRLVCIFEVSKTSTLLRVEVCLDTGSNSLSPFQRRVSLHSLWTSVKEETKKLLMLLEQTGQQSQPFSFTEEQLRQDEIQTLLYAYSWCYTKYESKGSSVKRSLSIENILPKRLYCKERQKGLLLGGELLITSLNAWGKHIEVRLRYQDAIIAFHPIYTEIPFLTLSNRWYQRDKSSEEQLLAMLGDGFERESGLLNLNDYDVERLRQLSDRGWTVYIPREGKKYQLVKAKRNKSGIIWFTSKDDDNDDISDRLLTAYLQDRNYQEADDKITLLRKQDALEIDSEVIASLIAPNQNLQGLYREEKDFTPDELDQIDKSLAYNLHACLKPYQYEGVIWLKRMRKNNCGCLLADDMGLGKTIQVLAHLSTITDAVGMHVVIAPTSLIDNWQNEIAKFVPEMKERIEIVTYDMVRLHLESYQQKEYDTIVIDEGQIIKNQDTQKYKAIGQLNAKHRIMLTGTPIENSIQEIWAHFGILIPATIPLYKHLQQKGFNAGERQWIELSRALLSPFILRRTKE